MYMALGRLEETLEMHLQRSCPRTPLYIQMCHLVRHDQMILRVDCYVNQVEGCTPDFFWFLSESLGKGSSDNGRRSFLAPTCIVQGEPAT